MKNSIYTKSFVGLLMAILIAGCSTSDDVIDNTNNSNNNNNNSSSTTYDITPILNLFDGSSAVSYAVNGNTVTFTTNNLPDHTSPYWPTNNALYEPYNGTNSNFNQNPNTISTQNITFTITLNPSEASVKQATSLGPIGIARNGVVFYNQYAGPNNQPLTNEINSFDQWLGHPQNTGQYHYHIEPTYLTNQFGNDVFLGLLADGFPVYGPEENGIQVTNSDLDQYHGHTHATADFPDGIYHYHITPNEDPYINGNGYFGAPGTITQ